MKQIPKHLKKYIINQDYSSYNSINQSTWKFIMKISTDFFKKNAHSTYLKGLEKTVFGIISLTFPSFSPNKSTPIYLN